MNRRPSLSSVLRVSLSASICAVSAQAQIALAPEIQPQIAQGMFTNWSIGLSASPPLASPLGGPLLIRAPGLAGGLPGPWDPLKVGPAAVGHPDFSIQAIAGGWTNAITPAMFGSMSTGGDVTPRVDSTGRLQMTARNWYAILIQVDASANGETGSLIAARKAANGGSAANEVFSFYAPGPSTINSELENSVRVEYTRDQLVGANSGLQSSNIDVQMGLMTTDPTGTLGSLTPVRDAFYFTLSKAWLNSGNAPSFPLATGGPPRTVLASDICYTQWVASPPGWTMPVIAYPSTELYPGLSAENRPLVEIDAISVYKTSGIAGSTPPSDRVVFSLTPDSDAAIGAPQDQLLVYQRATPGLTPSDPSAVQVSTRPLMAATATGTPIAVSQQFRLRARVGVTGTPDNVTSVAGLDPNVDEVTPLNTNRGVGLALSDPPQGESRLGLTAIHTWLPNSSGTGTEHLIHVQVQGFDLTTATGVVCPFGLVQLYDVGPSYTLPSRHDSYQVAWEPIGTPYVVLGNTPCVPLSMSFPSTSTNNVPSRIIAKLYGVTPNMQIVNLRESWVLTAFP